MYSGMAWVGLANIARELQRKARKIGPGRGRTRAATRDRSGSRPITDRCVCGWVGPRWGGGSESYNRAQLRMASRYSVFCFGTVCKPWFLPLVLEDLVCCLGWKSRGNGPAGGGRWRSLWSKNLERSHGRYCVIGRTATSPNTFSALTSKSNEIIISIRRWVTVCPGTMPEVLFYLGFFFEDSVMGYAKNKLTLSTCKRNMASVLQHGK